MIYLPRPGVLAATQEIIGFLALLMAGLLPAMTVTATVLRGEGISARRVEEYTGALRAQMRFWGSLFAAAALSTLGIVIAKIFSAQDVHVSIDLHWLNCSEKTVTAFGVALAGSGLAIVMARLYPAYEGLVSLLQLNSAMARVEAIARDRTARDAFSIDLADIQTPDEYRSDIYRIES
ncbi:hypothetical protein [Novosphingobium sp. SG720]|uniref:hypothetical protein n=1 Tax=Novosphingobium sp. SG720 TaxID=2586998 RepID=UPI0014488BAC|nr:hypothetical protein [Novosphingobium sp. SG720]NKJ43168.1 hypothetical protein [Novosphingobium sp. SG720]